MSDILATVTNNNVYIQLQSISEDGSRITVFDHESALAVLLLNNVISLNNNWWREDLTSSDRESINVSVIMNDVFGFACSESEELKYHEIQSLYDHWLKDPNFGPCVWCSKKRKEKLADFLYTEIMKQSVWNLDEIYSSYEGTI